MLNAVWAIVSLPFRMVAWVVELLGRLAALVLGFTFMVVGVALWAGAFYILGLPVFVVGLVLTLRALG